MLKKISKLFPLVILLLHHAYAVPVHPQDDRLIIQNQSREERAANILLDMQAAGTLFSMSHASHAPHPQQQPQPLVDGHRPSASHHASQQPPQHQPVQHQPPASHHASQQHPSIGHSNLEQHKAASPEVQHASQPSQPQKKPDKKNKCTHPGCEESFDKSDSLTYHINKIHRKIKRRFMP